MGLITRNRRPLGRSELQERDDRIFLVASEDRYAVKQYFDGLSFRRVHVVVLPTGDDNKSAPGHVVDRMKEAMKKWPDLTEDDQCWICLDTDHRLQPSHMRSWVAALQQARQKQIQPAVSNPCFEVWLLLHWADDLTRLPQNPTAGDVEEFLKRTLPDGYNKTHVPTTHFQIERAREAVVRAAALDPNPGGLWPNTAGSHFYRLMQAIFESER